MENHSAHSVVVPFAVPLAKEREKKQTHVAEVSQSSGIPQKVQVLVASPSDLANTCSQHCLSCEGCGGLAGRSGIWKFSTPTSTHWLDG